MKVVVVVEGDEITFEGKNLRLSNIDTGHLVMRDFDPDTDDSAIAVFCKWDYWYFLSIVHRK